MIMLAGTAAAFICIIPALLAAQEPAPPPPQPTPPAQTPAPAPEKPKKQKYSHANDFLIIGTVFDPVGYAFPGVQLKIRRSDEKKFRWNDYTNSRGEFAVRVPQGTQYELVIHAKGFADQTRELDAKTGLGETRLSFRMEASKGEKK
jgi:hypothetical protein